MKKIIIKSVTLKNFKNHNLLAVDLPPGGILASGYNGSGKSSLIQSILWVLGATMPAEQILNSVTLAPTSVEMALSVDGEDIKLSRTLVPQKNKVGKVVASSSSYAINGQPEKASLFASKVAEMFGTKDWIYLINPSLIMQNKSNRNLLLAVAGCPTEKEFLQSSNPELAAKIGNTSFDDWQKQQERIVNDLGKKIQQIPGKTEELSALIQSVEEIDTTSIEERIKTIKTELSGVDNENATSANAFQKVSAEATALRNEAQKLRNLAMEKISIANREANKQTDEAENLTAEWNRTLSGLRRQGDQIKAEMSGARQDQARKEKQLAEINADIQVLANQCREISARVPSADGQCSACGVYCAQLQAKGIEAAIAANGQELDRTKAKGRATVAQRDQLRADLENIAKKIDGLQSMEHEVEARINALGEAPTAPERKVITETPESLALLAEAVEKEKQAEELIKANRLNSAQHPTELTQELQHLTERLTRGAAIAQTQKNNDKINTRINDLREEENELITNQLQHKQHIAQLKEFYKQYAYSVTESVNKLFDGTNYEIRLFETNMGNDKGVPVMQPMKDGSTNLCRSEAVIFGKFFVKRILSKYWNINAPMLFDDTESLDSVEKLRSEHQVIATRVERHELEITNIE